MKTATDPGFVLLKTVGQLFVLSFMILAVCALYSAASDALFRLREQDSREQSRLVELREAIHGFAERF